MGEEGISICMDLKKLIGQRIRERRKQLGLTQEELAERLGVSWSAVSKWEIGDRRPSDKLLQKLAKVLKVSPSYFLEENPSLGKEGVYVNRKVYFIPIYGEAQAGSFGGYAMPAPEEYFPTSEIMLKGIPPERVFWIKVEGRSMEPIFQPGDLVLVADPSWYEVKEGAPVVVVNGDGELTVKYYHHDSKNKVIILQPANPQYEPIVIPEKGLYKNEYVFFPVIAHTKLF